MRAAHAIERRREARTALARERAALAAGSVSPWQSPKTVSQGPCQLTPWETLRSRSFSVHAALLWAVVLRSAGPLKVEPRIHLPRRCPLGAGVAHSPCIRKRSGWVEWGQRVSSQRMRRCPPASTSAPLRRTGSWRPEEWREDDRSRLGGVTTGVTERGGRKVTNSARPWPQLRVPCCPGVRY